MIIRTVLAEDRGDRYVFTVRDADGGEEQHEVVKAAGGRMRSFVTISDTGYMEVGIEYLDGARSGVIPWSACGIVAPSEPGTAAGAPG